MNQAPQGPGRASKKSKTEHKAPSSSENAEGDAMEGVEEAKPAEVKGEDRQGRPSKRSAAKDVTYNDSGPAFRGGKASKGASVRPSCCCCTPTCLVFGDRHEVP